MSYLMNQELGQAILNYLGSQPYAQVSQMVAGMQQMGEINDQEFNEYMQAKHAEPAGSNPEGKTPTELDDEADAAKEE